MFGWSAFHELDEHPAVPSSRSRRNSPAFLRMPAIQQIHPELTGLPRRWRTFSLLSAVLFASRSLHLPSRPGPTNPPTRDGPHHSCIIFYKCSRGCSQVSQVPKTADPCPSPSTPAQAPPDWKKWKSECEYIQGLGAFPTFGNDSPVPPKRSCDIVPPPPSSALFPAFRLDLLPDALPSRIPVGQIAISDTGLHSNHSLPNERSRSSLAIC